MKAFRIPLLCFLASCLFYNCNLPEVLPPTDELSAEFTADKDSCTLPCTINFTNASKGASTYLWKFGDGDSSSEVNPSHLYLDGGTFLVELSAFDSLGNVAKDSLEVLVIDTNAPLAFFSIDSITNNGYAPTTVFFKNESRNAQNYKWVFGNGSASEELTPSPVTLEEAGTYTIELTVSDQNGGNPNTFELDFEVKEVQKFFYVSTEDSSVGNDIVQLKDGSFVVVGCTGLRPNVAGRFINPNGIGLVERIDSLGNLVFRDTMMEGGSSGGLNQVIATSTGGYMVFSRFSITIYDSLNNRIGKKDQQVLKAVKMPDNKIAIITNGSSSQSTSATLRYMDEEGNIFQNQGGNGTVGPYGYNNLATYGFSFESLTNGEFVIGGSSTVNVPNPGYFKTSPIIGILDATGDVIGGSITPPSGENSAGLTDIIELPNKDLLVVGYFIDNMCCAGTDVTPLSSRTSFGKTIVPRSTKRGDAIQFLTALESRLSMPTCLVYGIDSSLFAVSQHYWTDGRPEYIYELNTTNGNIISRVGSSVGHKYQAILCHDGGFAVVGGTNKIHPINLALSKTDHLFRE